MAKNKKATEKHLKDYQNPNFMIHSVYLEFNLDDTKTHVVSRLEMERTNQEPSPLKLHGERLRLLSVEVDGQKLQDDEYQVDDEFLTIFETPKTFVLSTSVEINPLENTYLDGLYKSKEILCTQNEPEGFRKITYYPDRPDVMSIFTTKIIANKAKYPVLLSNGNKVDQGDLDNNRHFVTWNDPFKKPAYLFALVAGDLQCIEDEFIRRSGKPVKLQIFCDAGCETQCLYAMEALKKSMKWDEEVFNLEYDLDIFMIVAVEAFNAGAMENKGLNIFNISCVLADQQTATDDNFIRVEKVIAHEYFHNWTGDRVTLRDWFQLTLKEGLTVFRDQEFTSDMHSRSVHRIENVSILRQAQFPEDEGPTAHPIRPKSYIEMNNFYTTTVYDKGAEIIRMVYSLLGKQTFFEGMKKYFELFDGQAITCEDFIHAMALASNRDFSQFMRWYNQKGTPELNVKVDYQPENKQLTITTEQSNPKEGKDALPLHFPLFIGLLNKKGEEIEVDNHLEITDKKQTFTFSNIDQKPFVSLNRDFSAPVKITTNLDEKNALFLMGNDSNDFNRWDSMQSISLNLLLKTAQGWKKDANSSLPTDYAEAFEKLLLNDQLHPSFKALCLELPSEGLISQSQCPILFDNNHEAHQWMKEELANLFEDHFLQLYHELNTPKEYSVNALDMGQRKLKNQCLSYLSCLNKEEYLEKCFDQFIQAKNMTDQFSALAILSRIECPQHTEAMQLFYNQWKDHPLVITKWLALKAASPIPGAVMRLEEVLKDPVFDIKIPNIVRATLGSFFTNYIYFHATDGSGYAFASKQIERVDAVNPSVAARLSTVLKKYPKLDSKRQEMMKASLEPLLKKESLSRNAYEIISKSLELT